MTQWVVISVPNKGTLHTLGIFKSRRAAVKFVTGPARGFRRRIRLARLVVDKRITVINKEPKPISSFKVLKFLEAA